MRYFRVTEYTEYWHAPTNAIERSVNDVHIYTEEDLKAIAWQYYWNSEVEEELEESYFSNLQNAIAFIERVDEVEEVIKTVWTVYSQEGDMTIIFEDVVLASDEDVVISTEQKGFYFGEPIEELTNLYYGKTKIDFD
jgi:hypothetical protein